MRLPYAVKPLLLLLFFSIGATGPVISNPVLLPVPQQISYGQGKVYLEGSVHFSRTVEEADGYVLAGLEQLFHEVDAGAVTLADNSVSNGIAFNRTGSPDPLPGIDEKVGRGQREHYQIKANDGLISITAPSSAGLFYAVQTLRQLISRDENGVFIPEVVIEDWPSMPYRGFMMDMTHMQLPTVEEIKSQIDFLSRWKVNQYYFYSETNIELEGYPLLAPEARFTQAEIQEIIDYASTKFVDVVPNINLYGHLHDLFKFEHYADLAITPYGREFNSTTLVRDTIVGDWIAQFSAMFKSPFMHIGFDEAWLIDVEARRLGRPAEQLFLEMLNTTLPKVVDSGKKPMIYTDMLLKYPEIIDRVNREFVGVPWYYTPRDIAGYSESFNPFEKRNIPFFVQSTTLNYFYVYPAYTLSLENHRRMFNEGLKNGSTGFIMSGWTDDTQALLRTSRPDMAYGGAISWNYENADDTTFYKDYAEMAYSSKTLGAQWFEAHTALTEAERLTRGVFGFTTDASRENPFLRRTQAKFMDRREDLRRARYLVEKAQIQLREAMKNDEDRVTFEAMFAASKGLELLTTRYLFAGRIIDIHRENLYSRDRREFWHILREVVALISSLSIDIYDCTVETKEAYRRAWMNEYTSYRWETASAKFDRELLFWLRVTDKLKELRHVPEHEELPPLNSFLDLNY